MKAAGYNVVYKGKWHCSKPAKPEDAVPADLEKYGFLRWNPPDAGANQTVPEAGGGFVDNDGRFVDSVGEGAAEGVLQYLGSTAAQQQPFFMVISLVNPHDVLFYPSKTFNEAGYDDSWLQGDIGVPATNEEDLSTKPTVQEEFLRIFNLTGKPKSEAQKRSYLNFYGNLMRSSDSYLVNVLDKLEETGLLDNTLIVRTADHGEMGLAHGGLRQKNFNFYEEAIRVPLVYSNPKLYPKPAQHRRARLPRRLPADAGEPGGGAEERPRRWQGVDYSKLVLNPSLERLHPGLHRLHLRRLPVRPEQRALPETAEPHRQHPRRALEAGQVPRRQAPQAAAVGDVRPEDRSAGEEEPRLQRLRTHAQQEREFQRLKRKLARVEKTRLQPLSRATPHRSTQPLREALLEACSSWSPGTVLSRRIGRWRPSRRRVATWLSKQGPSSRRQRMPGSGAPASSPAPRRIG